MPRGEIGQPIALFISQIVNRLLVVHLEAKELQIQGLEIPIALMELEQLGG